MIQIVNNFKNKCYITNVFSKSASWCDNRLSFCLAISDVRYRSIRVKTLEELGVSQESSSSFFHPGVTI